MNRQTKNNNQHTIHDVSRPYNVFVDQKAASTIWRFGRAIPTASKGFFLRPVALTVSLVLGGLQAADALAQSVVTPDGRTATTVNRQGALMDVTTGTVHGSRGFNSFSRFEVGQGDTLNLRLPDGTNTLVNMVYDAPIRIDGVLNSLQNNRIGGKVVFADPFGMVVGRTGVLNVGSLFVTTPTAQAMLGVLGAEGQVNALAAQDLIEGKLPQQGGSLIRIDGRINALERVRLQAEQVAVGQEGTVLASADARHQAAFVSAVNTQGLEAATAMVEQGGVIEIIGKQLTVAGSLNASGRDAGGTIRLGRVDGAQAEQVRVESTGQLQANALVQGNGGLIDVWGDNSNVFLGVISAKGGTLSGDGGFAEVSAKTGLVYDGSANLSAANGKTGTLLIDPDTVCIQVNAGDACSGGSVVTFASINTSLMGANFEVKADETLYVGSTTGTATSGHLSATSNKLTLKGDDVRLNGSTITTSGASIAITTNANLLSNNGAIITGSNAKIATNGGSIELTSTNISVGTGSLLDSRKAGESAGNITLTTKGINTSPGVDSVIEINGATLNADAPDPAIVGKKAGKISLSSRDINVKGGATLSALGEDGEVKLVATHQNLINIFGYKTSSAGITIDSSTIKAESVEISSESKIENKPFLDISFENINDDPAAITAYWKRYEDNAQTAALGTFTDWASADLPGLIADLTGINIVFSRAQTASGVTLKGNTLIEGTKQTSIGASATTEAGNGDNFITKFIPPNTLELNGKFGLGAMFVQAIADTKVDVGAGVTLKGGDLSIKAKNDAVLSGSVATDNTDEPADGGAGRMAVAAGVVISNVKSKVNLASGANIQSTGHIDISSMNRTQVENDVTASTGGGGKFSMGLALTLQDASSEVSLNTGIQDALSISVFSADKQVDNKTHVTATAGETVAMRFSKNVSAVFSEEGPATLLAAYKAKKDASKKEPPPQYQQDPLRVAGGFAIVVANNQSKTTVADGLTLHARTETDAGKLVDGSGQIAIGSWTEDNGSSVSAVASALTSDGSGAKTAPAAAVVVSVANMDAITTIGDNVTITGNQIGIFGQTNLIGREVAEANFFDKANWSNFSKVTDNLKLGTGVASFSFANSQVKATGSGDEKGFAGSVSVNLNDYSSHVEMGAGSKLFQNGSGSGTWSKKYTLHEEEGKPAENEYAEFRAASAITLDASNSAVYMANAGPLFSSQEKGSGVGIANAILLIDTHANVIVREGVEMSGVNENVTVDSGTGLKTYTVASQKKAEDISLGAFNDNLIVSFAAGGGKSEETSFLYMGTQNFLWNEARVKVDDEAKLQAKELSIDAADTPQVFSLAGAISAATQKSGGAAFGFNYINTDTVSEIADNDSVATLGSASRASKLNQTGSFQTDTLNAHAHTGGAQYAVAVAGSVTDASNSTSKLSEGITKLTKAANDAMTKFNTMMGDQQVDTKNKPTKQKQDFKGNAFSGAGSIAGNINDLRTTVNLDSAKGQTITIDAVATGDSDIVSAAGAGAFTLMGPKSSASGSTSVAGAVALNVIGNAVQTRVNKLDFTGVDDATFMALKGGENLSLALGMTVTTGSQDKDTTGFAGVASLSFDMPDDWANGTGPSRNNARVTINDSSIAGDGDADLKAVAYNSSLIGTGGGSGTAGSKKSVGASITVTDLGNDTSVTVTKLTTTGFENETFLAHSASQIVAAAASASVAVGMKDSSSLNGSVVINYVGNTTTVAIDQSSLSASKGTKAAAKEGVRQAEYEAKLDQGAVVPTTTEDGETLGYDYNGSKTFTDSSVATSQEGSSILAIAGVVQVSTGEGSKNIGASVVSNTVNNDTTVSITNSSNNSGQLEADANSEAYIRAFAVGASGSKDKSIGGSVAVNVIDNDVSAQISASNSRGARANAKDKSSIDALAGQLQVSTANKGVAGGGAFSVNITSNDLAATVSGGTVTGGLSGGVSNVLVSTESTSRIRALNAAGAVSVGDNTSTAFSGSLGVNVIANTQEARVSSVTLTGMSGSGDTLSVTAKDDSTIQTLSGSVSATQGAAYGGAMSINTIANDTQAKLLNVNGASLETVKVASENDAQIDALAVGVSASSDKLAIAGSVAVNTISSDSKVILQGGSISGSQLDVAAKDSSDINTLSGSVAITGGTSAAVGAAGSVNTIANEISVDVSSNLSFTGAVNISAKQTGANIKAAAVGAAGGQGNAIEGSLATNTITNDVMLNVRDSSVSGSTVTVEATDTSDIKALAGGVAVSVDGLAVGAALAVNTITNSVNSTVSNSSLTAGSGLLKLSATNDSGIFAIGASAAVSTGSKPSVSVTGSNNVIVNDTVLAVTGSNLKGVGVEGLATDTAEIDAINGSVAVSVDGVAVGGAISNNNIVNTVRASANSQVVGMSAQRTNIDAGTSAFSWQAVADTDIDALAAGAAGSSGVAVSGALVNNFIGKAGQKANVESLLAQSDVKAGSVSVKALDSSDIDSLAGSAALSVGKVAVGGAVSGNTLLGNTRARIDGSDIKTGTGSITVQADRNGLIRSLAAAAAVAGGQAAVAGSAAANTITDDTEAFVATSSITGGATSIVSKDSSGIQTLSGAAAVTVGTAGVGFAASVNTITNKIDAGANGATFALSGALSSAATSDAKIDSIAVAMSAAGTAAVAPSAAVNTVTNSTKSKITTGSGSAVGASISAKDDSRIRTLTGAVALDFGGGAGVGGAGSVNTITNDSVAELDGGTWNFGSGNVAVSAENISQIQAIAASAAISANVGVGGSLGTETIINDTFARAKNLTISSVGAFSVKAKDDSKIDAIAGAAAIGAGGAGVGAAVTVNTITNDVVADVDAISITSATGVNVESSSGAKIRSIAAAGAGSSSAAVGGSSSTNTIAVNNSSTLDGSTISTGTLNVTGTDSSSIQTLAGSVALSGGVSVGGALAINTITNDNIAHIGASAITHTGAATISSKNTESIEALAAAGAGSAGISVSGSVAVNTISNDTLAEVDTTSLLGGASGDISVMASDKASIKSLAGAAAIGGGTSVGVAVASNIITNDVDAKLRGGTKLGGGYHTLTGRHVIVDAESVGEITSMTMAGAGDATAGVAGSASVNVIANDTRAVIDRNADVLADGNVVVSAESVNDIKAIGGAVGVGLAAAGVGGSIGVSVISGETSATIGGNDGVGQKTKVDGRANATASTISTGELLSTPSVGLPNKNDIKDFVAAPLTTGTQFVKGVAVTAESRRRILEGAASAGISGTAGVAVTVNVNANLASTIATVQSADVNTRGSAGSEQDVTVLAANHSLGNAFVGTVAVGIAGAGVGGALQGSGMGVDTKARILDSTVNAADDVVVKARASETSNSMVVGLSAGFVGVQGSAAVTILRGSTEAAIYDGSVTAGDDVTVQARHDAGFGTVVGALSGGLVGAGFAVNVGVNNHTTVARIGAAESGETETTTVNAYDVNVDADSNTTALAATVVGTAGGAAFGGAVGVVVLDDTAKAFVNKTNLTANAAGKTSVTADLATTLTQIGGAAAVGGVAGGASLGVALSRGIADAYIKDSTVTTGQLQLEANNLQDFDTASISAALAGANGFAGSVQVSMIGYGSTGDRMGDLTKDDGAFTKASSFSNSNHLGENKNSDGSAYDDTNSDKSKFTTQNRDTVNTANKYNFATRLAATGANTTRARVINSSVTLTTDASIKANTESALRNSVGAVGVGIGFSAVAASVAVSRINNDVQASIDATSKILSSNSSAKADVSVLASAKDRSGSWSLGDTKRGIVSRAATGAASLGFSGSATVSDNVINNAVSATVVPAQLKADNVTISAADSMSATGDALAGQISTAAAGAAVTLSERKGSVSAVFTPAASGNSEITSLDMSGSGGGLVSSKVKAGVVGLGASLSGNVATVSDSQGVLVQVGSGADVDVTGDVSLLATRRPELEVDVVGVGVSAGLQVSASVATATVSGDTRAEVLGGDVYSGKASVKAQNLKPLDNGLNIDGDALAAGGGLLLGANGAVVTVSDSSNVLSYWKDNSLANGAMDIQAIRSTEQFADATAVSVGFIGAGAVLATSNATGNTHAAIDGWTISSAGRTADVTVIADSRYDSSARAIAGTGGIIAGSAAIAKNNLSGATTAKLASTSTNAMNAGNVTLRAQRTNEFNARVDTVNASLVGASGAYIDNDVNTSTTAEVGASSKLLVQSFNAEAKGVGRKTWWDGDSGANGAANINSGSGGLIDAAGATSETDYRQTNTVTIGSGVSLEVDETRGTDLSVIRLDASSDIVLRDKVVMNSGGAIPIAKGVSKQEVKQDTNTVTIGASSDVKANRGSLKVGSRSKADLDARVNVDTYGLAGAPDAQAWAKYTGSNTVTVEASAETYGDTAVLLASGMSSSEALNQFNINSDARTWNKTAIPIPTGPDAVSELNSSNALWIKAGSINESGKDIDLVALSGSDDINVYFGRNSNSSVTATGVGKDVYREAASAVVSGISNAFGGDDVSFDMKKSTINRATSGTVTVDGVVRVGLNRQEKLLIDNKLTNEGTYDIYGEDGTTKIGTGTKWGIGYTITEQTGGIGTITKVQQAVGEETWNRILWLRTKQADYAGTVEAAGYKAEAEFLENRLIAQGLATRAADGSIDFGRGSTGGLSPYDMAQQAITSMQSQVTNMTTVKTTAETTKTTAETVNTKVQTVEDAATAVGKAQGNISGGSNTLASLTSAFSTATTEKNTAETTYSGKYSAATKTNQGLADSYLTAAAKCNISCNTAEATAELAALTALKAADSALGTAAQTKIVEGREYTTANNNLTTRQGEVNSLVATFNTAQNDSDLNGVITRITISDYSTAITKSTVDAFDDSQKAYKTNTLDPATNSFNQATSQLKEIQDAITAQTNSLSSLSKTPVAGVVVDQLVIPDITVNLGDVRIRANQLTGAASGSISAPGDAQVTIKNSSSSPIKVNNISISSDGGNVRLNGFLVDNNTEVNRINQIDGGGVSSIGTINTRRSSPNLAEIKIESTYNPENVTDAAQRRPSPDIVLAAGKTIFNPDGRVVVTSESGSVLSQGNIRAGTLEITAKNGDFVQGYVNGFFHIGADPKARFDGATLAGGTTATTDVCTALQTVLGTCNTALAGVTGNKYASGGIVANGSVMLSARYLNINGTVQSGITDWQVTLDNLNTTLAIGDAAFFGLDSNAVLTARAAYLNDRGSGLVKTGNVAGARYRTFTGTNGISVAYDADQDELTSSYTAAAAANLASNGQYRLKTSGVNDNIGATYDKASDQFLIDGTAVKGGYIKLFGTIMNTEDPNLLGNGGTTPAGLKVADGFGNITINNSTGKNVAIGNLDAGAGAVGRLEISDIRDVEKVLRTPATTETKTVNIPFIGDITFTVETSPAVWDYNPILKNSTYTRDASGNVLLKTWMSGSATPANNTAEPAAWTTLSTGRSASYAPKADIRYQYATGKDQSTIREYQRVTRNFFGADSLGVDEWYQGELIRGPFVQNAYDIPDGQRLVVNGAIASEYIKSTSTTIADGAPTMDILRRWSECDVWLCITSRKYTQYRVTTPEKTITLTTVKGDHAIPISFIGSDSGSITISSNSNVGLQGNIRNLNGSTSITASNGSISQSNDAATITSKSVILQASGAVGTENAPIRISSAENRNKPLLGIPDVTISGYANNGDFRVRQFNANTVAGNVSSSGTINIFAKGSIMRADANSILQAKRVELTASEGSVGDYAGDAPINVRLQSADDPLQYRSHGLRIQARDNVNVYNKSGSTAAYGGELLVDSVTAALGSVRLKADGKIVDGNPDEAIDPRTWNQLIAFWDSTQLRGAASLEKQDKQVKAFENRVNRDYQAYWGVRNSQADPSVYDSAYQFSLTTAERQVFVDSGMTNAQVDQYVAGKTAEYHALHTRLNSLGVAGTSYNAGFSYVAAYTQPGGAGTKKDYDLQEIDSMLRGGSWTDRELGIALTPGLLKEVTNTNVTVKNPNVNAASKIELFSDQGVGRNSSTPVVVDLTKTPDLLTNAEKVALAAAERNDIAVSADGKATITQNKPLNVLAASLTAEGLTAGTNATGPISIASRGNLALDSVKTSAEARIKVLGNLTAGGVSPAANVTANTAILEAAEGMIGSSATALRIASTGTGGFVTARSKEGIYLTAPETSFNVDTIYTEKHIELVATKGAIGAAYSDGAMDVRGKTVNFTANGNIGSSVAYIDVGVDAAPDGLINATSTTGGVYLRGTEKASFILGNVTAGGDVSLDADTLGGVVNGNIIANGSASIVGGDDLTIKGTSKVTAKTGNLIVAVEDLIVDPGAVLTAGKIASFDAETIAFNGTLNTGSGQTRLNATVGDLTMGPNALIIGTGTGNFDAFGKNITMAETSKIQQNGYVRMSANGTGANQGVLSVSQVIGGNIDVNATSAVVGVGASNTHLRSTAIGGQVRVNTANIAAAGVTQGTGVGSSSQALRVATGRGYASTQTGDVFLKLLDAGDWSTISTGSGAVTVQADKGFTAQRVAGTGALSLTAASNGISVLDATSTTGGLTANAPGTLYFNNIQAAQAISLQAGTALTVGKATTNQDFVARSGAAMQVSQVQAGTSMSLNAATGGLTSSNLNAMSGTLAASASAGALTVGIAQASQSVNLLGTSVTNNSAKSGSGTDVVLQATGGNISYGQIDSAQDARLTARDTISNQSGSLIKASRDVSLQAASVSAGNITANQTGLGGKVSITGTSALASAGAVSGSQITVSAGTNAALSSVNTAGSLNLTAGGTANVANIVNAASAKLSSTGNASVQAGNIAGSLQLLSNTGAAVLGSSGKTVNASGIQATGATVNAAGNIQSTNGITLTSNTGAVSAASPAVLKATSGEIVINAKTSATIANAQTTAGNITISSGAGQVLGSISAGHAAGTGGDVLLTATAGGLNFSALSAGRDLNVTVRDAITRASTLVGNVTATGAVTMKGLGLTLGNVQAGGLLSLTSTSQAIAAGRVTSTAGDVALKSASNVTLTRLQTLVGGATVEAVRDATISQLHVAGFFGLKVGRNATLGTASGTCTGSGGFNTNNFYVGNGLNFDVSFGTLTVNGCRQINGSQTIAALTRVGI